MEPQTNVNHFPPLDMSGIEGNKNIKEILQKTRFHSYLIYGEKGSGRHEIAERIAQAFLCDGNLKNDGSPVPCGKCPSCKKALSGNSSDLIRIDGSVSTADLRTILDGMYFTPVEGVCRVFLFDNADKFKPQVQNLLLKAIEEPPKGNAFIFIAVSPESLLSTLRSRCLALRTDYTVAEENGEDEVFEAFAAAALRGDSKQMFTAAAQAENGAKDEKREAFNTFLRKVSDIMSREIKTASLSGNEAALKRAAAVKDVTDGVISKTASVNVNIGLWYSYLIIKISNIKN